MAKRALRLESILYPTPVVMVTSKTKDGDPNVMTASRVGILSANPAYIYVSIDKSRFSCSVIKETEEFVVNLVDEPLVRKLDQCGMSSGRAGNKFARVGLALLPASRVKAPLIAEAKVHLECAVRQVLEIGVQRTFIAEVLATQADESVLDAGGNLDYTKLKPLAYIDHEYWGLSNLLGKYGFSERT